MSLVQRELSTCSEYLSTRAQPLFLCGLCCQIFSVLCSVCFFVFFHLPLQFPTFDLRLLITSFLSSNIFLHLLVSLSSLRVLGWVVCVVCGWLDCRLLLLILLVYSHIMKYEPTEINQLNNNKKCSVIRDENDTDLTHVLYTGCESEMTLINADHLSVSLSDFCLGPLAHFYSAISWREYLTFR